MHHRAQGPGAEVNWKESQKVRNSAPKDVATPAGIEVCGSGLARGVFDKT